MTDQLVLIDSDPSWRMDSSTRERGIRGVDQARQALREARSRLGEPETDSDNDALSPAADTAGLASAA